MRTITDGYAQPLHPDEFITHIYLEPYGISGRELAVKLDVAASTLSRILKGTSRVTPEMALRLSKAIGRTPESWLLLQDNHDLWTARKHVHLKRVSRLSLATIQIEVWRHRKSVGVIFQFFSSGMYQELDFYAAR